MRKGSVSANAPVSYSRSMARSLASEKALYRLDATQGLRCRGLGLAFTASGLRGQDQAALESRRTHGTTPKMAIPEAKTYVDGDCSTQVNRRTY